MTDHTAPTPEQVADIASSAREDFDLIARLSGEGGTESTREPEVVRVFTDQNLGLKLGGVETIRNGLGIATGTRRWGLLGEIDAEREKGDEADKKVITKLAKQAKEVAEQLRDTSMVFTLQWVPPIVKESVESGVRNALRIGKGEIPKDRVIEWTKEYDARILVATLVKLEDVKSGGVKTKLTLKEAQALRSYLPDTEYARIDNAISRLLFQAAISDQATGSADF